MMRQFILSVMLLSCGVGQVISEENTESKLREEVEHTQAKEELQDTLSKNNWLHMEVTSACLDGELEEVVLHVRLMNKSHKTEELPLIYGPLLYRSYIESNEKGEEKEEIVEKYVRFSSPLEMKFLGVQHFRVNGTSHILVLNAEPDNKNRVGIAPTSFAPLETKCLVLRFKVLDVRNAGEERFYLRLIHEDFSLKNRLSYKESEFKLQVTPRALSRYQERNTREVAASEELPLSLSMQSAAFDCNVDGLLLHVQLKNHSEKPVRIGSGFRFKCIANEEDVALVLVDDEGGIRRGDMELAAGETENIIIHYDISKVKRTGKSSWKLRPSKAICNDLPFEITVHPPYGDIRQLDIRKDETSEDEFVLPIPPTVYNH